MPSEDVTTRFNVDISQLKKSMQDAQRQIRLANAEFKAASSGMDDWAHSADGIGAKLKQLDTTLSSQKTILQGLKDQYRMVAEEQGENSKGAQELAIKIANQQAAINKTKNSISQYEQALSEVDSENDDVAKSSGKAEKGIDDIGDAAKKSEKETNSFAKGLADLAKKGLAAVATAATGAVTAFLGSAEATREYREDINKLQTAYKTAGYSAETATDMYKSFFSVLGEEDRSVEAVNHLAKLTKNQDELAKWTDICTGVWGTFGDSLPIEGLTEAANETAKVGQVVGPLADALNWAGISEDEFNKKLEACNSEQERATLITNTLNETYAEAAANYKELNGDIMDAQRAQSELTDAMAKVGAAAEPVMTSIKLFGASILTDLLPNVDQLSEALTNLIKGEEGSEEALGNAISGLITTVLNKIVGMLPQLATVGLSLISNLIQGILAALPQLVVTAVTVINGLLAGLSKALPEVVLAIVDIIPKIIDALMQQLPIFINAAIQFFMGLVEAIPSVVQAITEALPTLITSIINGLLNGITSLTEGAVQLLMAIVDAIPQIIDVLIAALPQIITAIITGLVTAVPQLIQASITLFMAMVKAIPQIVIALANALPQIVDAITSTLLDNLPLLLDCALQLFMTLVTAIPTIIAELAKAIPKIISAIMTALGKLLPKLTSFAGDILKKLISFFGKLISEAASETASFVAKIVSGLAGLASKMWDKFKEGIDKTKNFFADIIKKAGEEIPKFIAKIVDKLKSLPGDMWEKFKDGVQKVVDFGSSLKTKAEEAGKKLVDGITSKIKGLPDDIKEIGKNIVSGLWNGINDKFEWLTGKIKSFANDVTDKIKNFFGIHSPSRVMRDQVGKYLALGVAEGITKNKDAVSDAMNKIKSDITAPIGFNVNAAKSRVVYGNNLGGGNSPIVKENNTSYTFNQYNTSPKPLNRLEIYRQTKNQLNFAKGV